MSDGTRPEDEIVVPPPPPSPPPPSPPRPGGDRAGLAVLGILLLLLGAGWLLSTIGVSVPWKVLLPSALILDGLVLILRAGRHRRHGGLVALGVVLTIIIGGIVSTNVSLSGTAGNRTFRPTSAAELAGGYHLGAGNLTIDLRGLSLPEGTTRLEASVGVGQLVVRVPSGAALRIESSSGIGQVTALGETDGGFGVHRTTLSPGYDGATTRLDLRLSVGVGQVEVTA